MAASTPGYFAEERIGLSSAIVSGPFNLCFGSLARTVLILAVEDEHLQVSCTYNLLYLDSYILNHAECVKFVSSLHAGAVMGL